MLKPKKRNIKRLLKFARHLSKLSMYHTFDEPYEREYCHRADCNIEHFSFVIAELPNVFKEWTFRDDQPKLMGYEKLSSLAATAVFFNLTGDELFHLFVPNFQEQLYDGKQLCEWSNLYEFVDNLYQFIYYKEGKSDDLEKIEIEKYRNLLKNKNYHESEISNKVYSLSA